MVENTALRAQHPQVWTALEQLADAIREATAGGLTSQDFGHLLNACGVDEALRAVYRPAPASASASALTSAPPPALAKTKAKAPTRPTSKKGR